MFLNTCFRDSGDSDIRYVLRDVDGNVAGDDTSTCESTLKVFVSGEISPLKVSKCSSVGVSLLSHRPQIYNCLAFEGALPIDKV